MELYLKIGALMEKHGFTNQSMADASGVPVGTVSGIRSGKISNPGFESVCAIMAAMSESVDVLVGIVPTAVPVDEERLDADGYTETERRAIIRWAGSEIARSYQAVVAALEARLNEKNERISHRTDLLERERRRAHQATVISYLSLGLFVLLFFIDFLMPSRGWIIRQ